MLGLLPSWGPVCGWLNFVICNAELGGAHKQPPHQSNRRCRFRPILERECCSRGGGGGGGAAQGLDKVGMGSLGAVDVWTV